MSNDKAYYETKEWFVGGKCVALPSVGTELEWKELTGFQWVKAKVLFISETSVVLQRIDGFEWQMPTKRVVFRPHPQKSAPYKKRCWINGLHKGWILRMMRHQANMP